MSATQNGKIRQVTETIIVIGMNIASEAHWGRVFDWCDLKFGKGVKFENSAEGFIFFLCRVSELATEQKKDGVMVGLEPAGAVRETASCHELPLESYRESSLQCGIKSNAG